MGTNRFLCIARFVMVAILCCAAALTAAADENAALPPAPVRGPLQHGEYLFQIGLYRLKQPAEGEADGIRFFPERHPAAGPFAHGAPHAFGSLACEQCHMVNWTAQQANGHNGGTTFADRVVGKALTHSVAEVIAEPILTTVKGRPAHLRLQGGEVEYFVSEGDGRFRVEKVKDETGIEVRLLVADEKEENDSLNVTVEPFEIRITTLDHREPIEGSGLAVGKPVFKTFEWDAKLSCRPGQINAFTLDSPRQGRILVVVRLEVGGSDEEGDDS